MYHVCVCVRARARNQRRDESIVSLISKNPEKESGIYWKDRCDARASTVAVHWSWRQGSLIPRRIGSRVVGNTPRESPR